MRPIALARSGTFVPADTRIRGALRPDTRHLLGLMRMIRIDIEAAKGRADRIEAAAYALGVQGLEIIDASSGGPVGRVTVRLYLPEGREALAARATIERAVPDAMIRASPFDSPAESVDAERRRPRRVHLGAGFVLCEDERPTNGRVRLRVDARAAFGDGVHPTTRLVVEQMEAHVVRSRHRRALDVGAGTGVLGLVALHLGVREVVATDIDALARAATKEATARHALAARMSVRKTLPSDTFPLVVANLYRDVLLTLAPRLAARVAPRGTLIISGFGAGSRAEVLAAFEAHGLRVKATRSRARWCVAVLVRR